MKYQDTPDNATLDKAIKALEARLLKLISGLDGGTRGGMTQLTGPVTAGPGSGEQATTITPNAVTYTEIQDVSAASKLLGRGDSGAGDPEEITLGSGLSMTGTTLSAAGSSYTDEQAQDAVGAMIADTATIDLTYTDATPELKADVKTDAIDNTLLANMAQATIKGRASGAGTGDPTDLTANQTSTILDTATDPFLRTSAASADAPANADYLVKTANGTLSAERVVTDTPSIVWDWATAGQAKATRAAVTGDVTIPANSNTATLANIPTATPMAGSLLATAIAAPSTPASGKGSIYVDSTSKNLAVKDDAGAVKHGVKTIAAVSGQFVTSIDDDGTPHLGTPAGSAGGALTLISEVVTSASQSTATFSSIPNTYRHLRMIISARGDASAANVELKLRFNGDSGLHYFSQRWWRTGSDTQASANAGQIGYIGAATGLNTTPGVAEIVIPDYRTTTYRKGATFYGGLNGGTLTTDQLTLTGVIWWTDTSAITQIDVLLSAGNFVNGSVISLYGCS